MFRVFYYADRIAFINDAAYHYNQANLNAITATFGRLEINQMLNCAKLIDAFYANKPDKEAYLKSVNAVKFLAKLYLVTTRFDWLKEFYEVFPESDEAVKYVSLNAFSTKGKIRFLFVKYHIAWLFVILFKTFNLFRR